jgi:hypothetical protein
MKKERQKTENEKLFEFGTKLRELVGDINLLKNNIAQIKLSSVNGKEEPIIKIILANDFIIMELNDHLEKMLIQEIERQIEQKTAELNELKKHITL